MVISREASHRLARGWRETMNPAEADAKVLEYFYGGYN
jgi:hypothetical protein